MGFFPSAFETVGAPPSLKRCAVWAEAGVSLFELARFMGRSVDQIDKTYGHLLPDALDRTRQTLDTFVEANEKKEADASV